MTGASGSLYGLRFLQRAVRHYPRVLATMSRTAHEVLEYETGIRLDPTALDARALGIPEELADRVRFFAPDDYRAPMASGSSAPAALVIAPCSMGTLARIAAGVSGDLITRTADVALKERRPLLLLVRETPYSLIHLRNMTTVTEAGATVFPASPGLYTRPRSVEEMIEFVVQRLLDHLGIREDSVPRWSVALEE
jgi:flavin prenyltransferase